MDSSRQLINCAVSRKKRVTGNPLHPDRKGDVERETERERERETSEPETIAREANKYMNVNGFEAPYDLQPTVGFYYLNPQSIKIFLSKKA